MALKTFNVNPSTYDKFHVFCKSHGMSMSAQVQSFMESVMAEDFRISQQYLLKLQRIRAEPSISIPDPEAWFDDLRTRGKTYRAKEAQKARRARSRKV